MTTFAQAPQTVLNCRFTRLGYRLRGIDEHLQPESQWVCVRDPGQRRCVTEQECRECQSWEGTDPDISTRHR